MWLPMSGTAFAGGAEAVWREFHDELLGFIARRVRTREDAEDILQEVMLRIHRSSGDLEHADRVTGWIYRIASNAIIDHYRRPARREFLSGDRVEVPEPVDTESLPVADESSTPELRGELARCLRPLIERLPVSFREALVLTEFDGVTQAEAAARLGLSVSGMKARVQRGRSRLKGALLDCCHVELDRRGGVTSYNSRSGSCETCGQGPKGAPSPQESRGCGSC
jgi:RNA polymerase sigma-70 factor (ECF subfamily)